MESREIFFQDGNSFLMRFVNQGNSFLVHLAGRSFRARASAFAAKVFISFGLKCNHTEPVRHAETGDHGACKLCGLLNIVRGAGSTGTENQFLRRAAAGPEWQSY